MLVEYNGPSLQQVASLAKTDPQIQQALWPRDGLTLATRCDREPFTDIRVRKALQMAIDCKTIAQSYYGGAVDGTPVGFITPLFADWTTPYNQWPADLQAEYSYNPEKARELLAEANLAGGFTTDCVTASVFDLELLQIVKSYLMDIGVDMTIETYDMPVFDSITRAGEFDQAAVTTQTGRVIGPIPSFQSRTTGHWQNYTYNNDPKYDAMVSEMMNASSLDEAKRLAKEMDLYILSQHWAVNTTPMVNPVIWQPWVQGYSGEFTENNLGWYYARFWIDQSLK
jgi:peptide/nickel transport system substrate-binding protein